jgi:hypothetical protein
LSIAASVSDLRTLRTSLFLAPKAILSFNSRVPKISGEDN